MLYIGLDYHRSLSYVNTTNKNVEPASHQAAWLPSWLREKNVIEARKISPRDIVSALGGLPEESEQCSSGSKYTEGSTKRLSNDKEGSLEKGLP